VAVVVKVSTQEGDILFESEPSQADLTEMGLADRAKDLIKEAGTTYESIASLIKRSTDSVLTVVDDLSSQKRDGGSLTSAQLEIGVKVTGEGNVIVAKGTAEANLKISLTWDFH
jgi:hypothetical protein